MADISVRWMYHADVPRVLTIERLCCGAQLDNTRALERFLRFDMTAEPLFVEFPTSVGLVAEVGGRVVGFVLFQVDWLGGMATVLRLAVLPERRRQCVGSRLLRAMRFGVDHMRRRLRRQGYDLPDVDFLMYVPESDLICQLFLRAQAFRCVRILKAPEADGGILYLFRYAGTPCTPSPGKPSLSTSPTP